MAVVKRQFQTSFVGLDQMVKQMSAFGKDDDTKRTATATEKMVVVMEEERAVLKDIQKTLDKQRPAKEAQLLEAQAAFGRA